MAKDKPGIVAKGNWHMAKFHPAFGFPAPLFDFFRPEVFGADDAVVPSYSSNRLLVTNPRSRKSLLMAVPG
jgi:hypothetical protein